MTEPIMYRTFPIAELNRFKSADASTPPDALLNIRTLSPLSAARAGDVSARSVLEPSRPVFSKFRENYPELKSIGRAFLAKVNKE